MEKIKDCLLDVVHEQLVHGIDNVDAEELGAVVDMIKDIAQATKYCSEKKYYDSVATSMHTGVDYVKKPATLSWDMYKGYEPMPTTMSRYDEMKEMIEESDPDDRIDALDQYTRFLQDDIKKMMGTLNATDKTFLKQHLMTIAGTIM